MDKQITGRTVYLVDGARTPFIRARGVPGPFSASDLAVQAGRVLLMRQPFSPEVLDEVIMGCVIPGPDEANIARIIALRLGCGNEVTAWTVQRNCASGMQALDAARQRISSGASDMILAGGTEAMSRTPLLLRPEMVVWLAQWQRAKTVSSRLKVLRQLRPAYLTPVVALLRGLTDPLVGLSMGQTAEELAWRFGISRFEMDRFALASHQRLDRAKASEGFDEIVPLIGRDGVLYEHDDGVRPDSLMEQLQQLKPVFDRPNGVVTAGNSAQVSDGAALLLLASGEAVERYQLPVLGVLEDVVWRGLDPSQMGLGPAYAIPPLLMRNGLLPEQVDRWEINEAFAVQVLANLHALQSDSFCRQELGLEQMWGEIPQRVLNCEGGAIAIGHPVGASGARIVLHLLYALKAREEQCGVASLCIGGGQGGAALIRAGEGP